VRAGRQHRRVVEVLADLAAQRGLEGLEGGQRCVQPVGRVGDVEAAAAVVHGVCDWGVLEWEIRAGWLEAPAEVRDHACTGVGETEKLGATRDQSLKS